MSRDSNSHEVEDLLNSVVHHSTCETCLGYPKRENAKIALEAYITSKVNEARIDELKELPAYKYGSWQAMTNEWIDARIKELQSK